MINSIIALFFPSIIAYTQCNKLFGELNDIQKIIKRYMLCVLYINMIVYAITIYIFKQPWFIFTNQFTLKYVLLSIFISYITPIIGKYVIETIKIDFKVKKNEK